MNRAYKLVWNAVSNSWVVASELARGRKKSAGTTIKLALCIASVLGAGTAQAAPAPNTLPTGGALTGNGVYSIDSSVPNQLTINQSDVALLATWTTFSIGSNAKVIFNQPDSNSFTFNRVIGGSPSEIFGQVQANGQFVLANPSGITFGAGSQVNAAAIVASANDRNYVFFTGNAYGFQASSSTTAKVENYGTLTATAGGVTLLGSQVVNAGNIIATGGDVRLLNAGLTGFNNGVPTSINPSAITGFIQNSGSIAATQVSSVGGKILLTGDTSQASSQIQLAGTLDASTNTSINGRSILVNGDVALNGASNVLDFTSSDGYNLTNGAAVNLNGASSGFSVNGTAYTVIRDVNQLQAMNSNVAGKYVLAANIDASDTVNWNSGAGFAPVGSAGVKFSGILDGLGHAVNALTINRPSTDLVGLFSFGLNSIIQNIGLTNTSITGLNYVGGFIGNYTSNSGSSGIRNSYVTGLVSGGSNGVDVGGFVGRWGIDTGATATLSNSYSTAAIQSQGIAGGLAGYLSVNGGNVSLSNTYATGAVSGGFAVGGLVGTNAALSGTSTVSNSYWDTTTTGSSKAVGNPAGGSSINVIGLSTSQLKNLASFAAWGNSIDASAGTGATWRIYDGLSAPLLRSFLKPVTATVVDSSKTYDATTSFSGSYTLSTPASLLGTATYNTASANVGQQTLILGGLYSNQSGYDLSVLNGTGTINKASLTISSSDVTKTYDATTSAAGNAVAAAGTQLFGTDSLTGGTFVFDNRNAGTGKHIVVSGVTVNDGNSGANYDVSYVDNTSSTINKASLSISATDASKVYDGTTAASSTAVVVGGGLFGTDTFNGATVAFADKNAGTGKHLVVSNAQISDGNNGDNYDVTYVDNINSSISKRLLTISAVADSKEYDGKLTATANAKPVITGRQRGDAIVGLTQSFADKNAGTGKAINVDAGYTIRDGNGGNNYNVVVVNSNAGVITPKALTISTVANTKIYDGGVTSANKPVVSGLAYGDRVTGLFQQYETKTVGTGKKLLIKTGYVLQDGNGGNNYTVTEQGSNDGIITAH